MCVKVPGKTIQQGPWAIGFGSVSACVLGSGIYVVSCRTLSLMYQ